MHVSSRDLRSLAAVYLTSSYRSSVGVCIVYRQSTRHERVVKVERIGRRGRFTAPTADLSASTPLLTPVCLQVFQTPIKLDARTISARTSYLWTSEAMSTTSYSSDRACPYHVHPSHPYHVHLMASLISHNRPSYRSDRSCPYHVHPICSLAA